MRFEAIAGQIRALIAATVDYGDMDPAARIDVFEGIGDLLEGDRGFGFRVRSTVGDQTLLRRWSDVLGWWMHEPGVARPAPESLRDWQRFVADNLEFRLGVAVGAVVAQAWSDGAPDALTVPNLADWKATTGLPWFGFWARELLRWGTHDPFVAFCLSQGLAHTREAAARRRPEFDTWLDHQVFAPDAEDRIDPQRFNEWRTGLPRDELSAAPPAEHRAQLTGTDGRRGRYAVVPVRNGDATHWLDPAGFELAVSDKRLPRVRSRRSSDYELRVAGGRAIVTRVFRPT